MKQKKNNFFLLAGVITLAGCVMSSCTEEVLEKTASNRIVFSVYDQGFNESKAHTRGAKVSSITSFGVSASVYSAAASYTSAGCGSYFYNESATAGLPTDFFWPTSSYKVSFFAHYPFNNAAFTVQSASSALGAPTYAYTVPSAIGSQLDIMTGQNVNILGGGSSPVALTMKHRCAAIRFSVTNNRSTAITLNSVSIEGVKYSGTLNEDTWTLTSAVNSSSSNPFTLSYGSSIDASATVDITGTTNIFLMLPQTLPATAKVKLVVDSEELEAAITGSWVAGRQYNYSLAVKNNVLVVVDEESDIEDWKTTIDLSMVDNAGTARASMTTANCYLVHAAGKYKLPLVYGNAIKNGEDNRVAYYPGENSTITNGTNQFINHAGTPISGPWITKSTSGTGVNKGMGLTATSAELLWQDRSGLITSVSVNGDYLEFTVGSFGGGNALIAVKNGSTILWSWHIWATTETLASTTAVNTGSGGHTYNVAAVNLGWVPTGGSGKQGYCPYYQWGRKDPFIPCNGTTNDNTDKTIYNISGANITPASITASSTGIQYESSTSATIATNIQKPIKHYYNSSNYGPCNTTYYNMWDAQNTATDNVTSATKKTIYDPCPPGFCIPTGNLWYYFGNGGNRTMSTFDTTNKGATWNTGITGNALWLPAAGYRSSSSGTLSNVGSSGYYWSATPSSTNFGRRLYFNSSLWYWSNLHRAFGFSVRPVAEE